MLLPVDISGSRTAAFPQCSLAVLRKRNSYTSDNYGTNFAKIHLTLCRSAQVTDIDLICGSLEHALGLLRRLHQRIIPRRRPPEAQWTR